MQPTGGTVSQEFGTNPHFSWQPWGHLGRDYAVPVGTPCVALAAGTVTFADWSYKLPKALADAYQQVHGSPASGIVVFIEHDGWRSMYAHLSSTHLNPGNRVVRATVVGLTGNSGNSTGPHLHKECFLPNAPWVAPFGRYDPRLQIAHEDKVAAALAAAAAARPRLAPHQRIVLAGGVNELDRPTTHGAKVLRTFKAGSVLNFKGYVIGQRVKGMNGWLVGISGGYFHVGQFTQRDVRGLPNLIRQTGGARVAYRTSPRIEAKNVKSYLKAHTSYVIEAWTTGDTYAGSNIWFKVQGSTGWAHSRLFTSQSTVGLKKL